MTAQPNSDIYILSGVPLDNDYNHTLYFNTAAAQAQTIGGYAKYKLAKQSYQRQNLGEVRVGYTTDDLFDCNYIMFRNTAYGDKWFYAFITELEFKNESMTIIHFELDVIQTWLFDVTLGQCFVEREHSATDGLFSNTVPENVDLGNEYIINPTTTTTKMSGSNYLLLATENSDGTKATPSVINGVFCPLYAFQTKFETSIAGKINAYINAGRENSILAIYQIPDYVSIYTTASGTDYDSGASTTDFRVIPNTTTVDGYIPRNKKLFSYPYNFISVSNATGQTAEIKWELWPVADDRGKFLLEGVGVSTPAIMCSPKNYRGASVDRESGLVLNVFPQCPWVGDTFKAWWAQNRASTITSGITTAISAGAGIAANVATGNIAGAVGGGINLLGGIANTVARVQDIKNAPAQAHGQTQTDSLNAALQRVGFLFNTLSVRAETARIIDDYFDRFGYATHRTKTPNRAVRPHWCYTKTQGCILSGSIPQNDAKKIMQIYDNGITFWKNPSEVGDYSLDNRV